MTLLGLSISPVVLTSSNDLIHDVQQQYFLRKERTSHELQKVEEMIKLAAQKTRKVLLVLLTGRPISGSSTRSHARFITSSGVKTP